MNAMHSRLQYFLAKAQLWNQKLHSMKPRLSQIPLQFLIALDDQEVEILLPGVCLTNI
jgi:hypothetical protein